MKKIILSGTIVILLLLSSIESTVLAQEIGGSGARHNGAFLYLTSKQDLKGKAVRMVFKIECRKNHLGAVSGYAIVEALNLESDDPELNPTLELTCKKYGGPDGAVKVGSISKTLTIRRPMKEFDNNYVVIGTVRHMSQDFTNTIINDMKNSFDQVVRDLKRETWENRDDIIKLAAQAGWFAF